MEGPMKIGDLFAPAGRVALVTGGTSGMGLATARLLLASSGFLGPAAGFFRAAGQPAAAVTAGAGARFLWGFLPGGKLRGRKLFPGLQHSPPGVQRNSAAQRGGRKRGGASLCRGGGSAGAEQPDQLDRHPLLGMHHRRGCHCAYHFAQQPQAAQRRVRAQALPPPQAPQPETASARPLLQPVPLRAGRWEPLGS